MEAEPAWRSERIVGPYQLEEVLGEGTTSRVFRARAPGMSVACALKLTKDFQHAESIRRELALVRSLQSDRHIGVVQMLHDGESDGLPWYAMEELPCGSLAQFTRSLWHGPRQPRARAGAGQLPLVLEVLRALAEALDHVHIAGAVHADLSPGNILFRAPGQPVLVDFGAAIKRLDIARRLAAGGWVTARPATVGYAAPERLLGDPWDSRADLYALGCIAYELVTGRPLFASDRELGLYRQHLYGRVVPPSEYVTDLPAELETLLLAMLSKDPYERTARASDVALALSSATSRPRRHTGMRTLLNARLAGRDEPLRYALATVPQDASAPCGGSYLVRAEPGGGLTRFLEEIALEALKRGYRVFCADSRGPGDERGGALALFSELLDALCSALEDGTLRLDDPRPLAPLVPYHPAIARRCEAAVPLPDVASRERLFAALLWALTTLAEQRRCALIIDHGEEADSLSHEFIAWLLARGARTAHLVLWVGVTEDEELEQPGVARSLAREISLRRLNYAESARMVGDLLGEREPHSALIEAAYRFSGGNPHVLAEYAGWAARRLIDGAIAPALYAHPGSLAEVLATRIAALPPAIAQIGALASLFAGCFAVVDVASLRDDGSAPGAEQEPTQSALELLVMQRFLRRTAQGLFRFRHASQRRAFHDLLPSERARSLHARMAKRLVAAGASPALQAELGQHWVRAGRADLAVVALRRASKHAAARYAFDDALEALHQSFTQTCRLAAHSRRFARIAQRRGYELLALYSRAARHERVQQLGVFLLQDAATSALLAGRVCRLMALSSRICGEYTRALAQLDEAERALSSARTSSIAVMRERINQQTLRARLHYVLADADAMWAVVAEALPEARRSGRATQISALYMDAANALVCHRRYTYSRRAVWYQRRARALLADSAASSCEGLLAQFDLAFMLLLGGRSEWEEARSLLTDAARKAPPLGDAALSCRIELYLAIAERRLNNQSGCREAAERALRAAEACSLRGYVGAAKACFAWLAVRAQQPALAEQLVDEACKSWWRGARSDAERRSEYPFQWLAHAPAFEVMISEERYDDALPLARELLHPAHAWLDKPVRALLSQALSEEEPCARACTLERAVQRMKAHGYL